MDTPPLRFHNINDKDSDSSNMTNKNISIFSYCYGCSLCAVACPKDIITLRANKEGFYQPIIIDWEACIQCGLCLKVCAFHNELSRTDKTKVKGYATWSKNPAARKRASSGGTGFEIARSLLGKGYHIVAVRYNAKLQRAEHYIATSETDLIHSMGSKYIQSYPEEAFKAMEKTDKYLVTGTPCQIASMRRYIKMKHLENNVILMDFFCHGVPSKLLWDKYIAELEPKIGKVVYASWRNKSAGWHDSWVIGLKSEERGTSIGWHDSYNMLIRKKTTILKKRSEGDMFYKFFLSDVCFSKACYKDCKFKNLQSAADIRIGDLWGTKYADNEEGVTGVLTFTEQGQKVLEECDIVSKSESIEVVTEAQLKKPISRPYYHALLLRMLGIPQLRLSVIYRIVQLLRIGTILKYKLHLK